MITSFNRPIGNESVSELADMVAKLQKQMEFIMNGNIADKNIREVGGWLADGDRFVSIDGDVGMSTAYTGGDDVRFWAGSTIMELAPFRVLNSGKAYLTGAEISSSGSYPKVTMDPSGALFGAYTSATEYVEIRSQHYSSGYVTPLIEFGYAGNPAFMYYNAAGFGLSVASDININANGDLVKLSHGRVPDWSHLSTPTETIAAKFSYYDSQISSLNIALANKSNIGHTHSVSIPGHNHGISDMTGLATSGGGSVTYSTYGGTTVTAF
jgi:hypothetical protein